jgi:hypothetical protein
LESGISIGLRDTEERVLAHYRDVHECLVGHEVGTGTITCEEDEEGMSSGAEMDELLPERKRDTDVGMTR